MTAWRRGRCCSASTKRGTSLQHQRDAGIEAIESGSGFDWEGLGFFGINALLALVGGPFLVRRMRGPPTQKVGLPATKVLQ